MKRNLLTTFFTLFLTLCAHAQDTTWNAKFILSYGPYTDTVYFGCSTSASDGLDTLDEIDSGYSYRDLPIAIRSGIEELSSAFGCANLKRNYKSFKGTDSYGAITFEFYAYVNSQIGSQHNLFLNIDSSDFMFSTPPYTNRSSLIRSVNGYVEAYDVDSWIFYEDKKFSGLPILLLKENPLFSCTDATLFKFLVSIAITTPSGINNQPRDKFYISPNPVKDVFTVKPPQYLTGDISIVDMQGRVVLKKDFSMGSEIKCDATAIKPGIYMVVLHDKSKDSMQRQKIIIQK